MLMIDGLAYGGDYNPEQWGRDVWREDVEASGAVEAVGVEPLGEVSLQRCGNDRGGEQESLTVRAAHRAELGKLDGVFDALRDGGRGQVLRQSEHGLDDGAAVDAAAKTPDDAAIDLQHVEGILLDVAQR
jgi:hypothetical protein